MRQGSIFGSMIWTGIYRKASESAFGRQFHALSRIPGNAGAFSGQIKNPKIDRHIQSSILGILGMKLGLVQLAETIPFPCTLSFKRFVHSGEKTEVEAEKIPRSPGHEQVLAQGSGNGVNEQLPLESEIGSNLRSMGFDPVFNQERRPRVNTRPPLVNEAGSTPMSMGYVQGILRGSGVIGEPPLDQPEVGAGSIPRLMDDVPGIFMGRGSGPTGGSGFYNQQQLESNADIVHIKLMRNNSYVTLTDDKGNRKMSVSAGQVAAKGDKPGRYSGEAAAEYMGRVVKQMKIRSVVVKVSGFTYFKRKKDAILAFKDGYTHSRGDVNPIVYIEDTTRKPHNGCRLPKSRRI